MTPFVDVMLVLLIIFMVAAPLLTVGVPIDLPETSANAMNSETQPITISVNENGQIYLQETEIPLEEVVAKLTAIATTGYEERIYVRGDKTTTTARHAGDGPHPGRRIHARSASSPCRNRTTSEA